MKYFCRQASQLSSDALDRPLSVFERFRMLLHQGMCHSCRRVAKDIRLIHHLLGQSKHHVLTDQQRKKILHGLKKMNV